LTRSALRRGREAASGVLDFLLPRACVACERSLEANENDIVCGRCWARVRQLPHPQCERCGHPVNDYRCQWCDILPQYVRAARSFCWVNQGQTSAIVHALKYHGWTAAASGMASRIARLSWPVDVLEERAGLIPVPLAPVRARERGFNQSMVLASMLSRHWRLPVWDCVLTRMRATATQTRLTPEERRSNVSGAFTIAAAADDVLRGRHVVLVDDVVTTGATLNECAATLFEGGARIISFVTFARAPASADQL
jgi:ComF family protein